MSNWAQSTVATAPSPPTTGTTLVVASGEGSRFPTANFLATVFPADALPNDSNAELVLCTSRTGDTLTITRQQEGSTARTIGTGDRVYAGLTQGMWDNRSVAHAADDPHSLLGKSVRMIDLAGAGTVLNTSTTALGTASSAIVVPTGYTARFLFTYKSQLYCASAPASQNAWVYPQRSVDGGGYNGIYSINGGAVTETAWTQFRGTADQDTFKSVSSSDVLADVGAGSYTFRMVGARETGNEMKAYMTVCDVTLVGLKSV